MTRSPQKSNLWRCSGDRTGCVLPGATRSHSDQRLLHTIRIVVALIDAGWAKDGPHIKKAAECVFGADTRPASILLTHFHPDHAGSALQLARIWDCPVYVHPDELPLAKWRLRSNREITPARSTTGSSCPLCAPWVGGGVRRCSPDPA